MPAVRGDGMRGLAVFISDIRNCKHKLSDGVPKCFCFILPPKTFLEFLLVLSLKRFLKCQEKKAENRKSKLKTRNNFSS